MEHPNRPNGPTTRWQYLNGDSKGTVAHKPLTNPET